MELAQWRIIKTDFNIFFYYYAKLYKYFSFFVNVFPNSSQNALCQDCWNWSSGFFFFIKESEVCANILTILQSSPLYASRSVNLNKVFFVYCRMVYTISNILNVKSVDTERTDGRPKIQVDRRQTTGVTVYAIIWPNMKKKMNQHWLVTFTYCYSLHLKC